MQTYSDSINNWASIEADFRTWDESLLLADSGHSAHVNKTDR